MLNSHTVRSPETKIAIKQKARRKIEILYSSLTYKTAKKKKKPKNLRNNKVLRSIRTRRRRRHRERRGAPDLYFITGLTVGRNKKKNILKKIIHAFYYYSLHT